MAHRLRKNGDSIVQIELEDVSWLLPSVPHEAFISRLHFHILDATIPFILRNWKIVPANIKEEMVLNTLFDAVVPNIDRISGFYRLWS